MGKAVAEPVRPRDPRPALQRVGRAQVSLPASEGLLYIRPTEGGPMRGLCTARGPPRAFARAVDPWAE
eukprot:1938160-Pyramimonas_sp.AAC.1